MNIRKLMLALSLSSIFCVSGLYSQIDSVKYQLRYNTTTCRYDAFVIFTKGNATTAVQRTQFNAQFSVVVPTGTAVTVAQNFMPLTGNTGYAGTIPLKWVIGSVRSNPEDNRDYVSITPTLSPTAQYNNIVQGDSVRIFSLTISPVGDCGANVWIFRNGIDPGSNAPGMDGGDFSNGFTIGNIVQKYNGNVVQRNPPIPLVIAAPTCRTGLEIDLTATTSSCQSPLTYSWTGPNGYSSTTQDVSIPNATPAATGNYLVTVTDKLGCTSTRNVAATAKPVAGSDFSACAGTYTLTGSEPNTGTWESAGTNPPGATVGTTSGGQASLTLSNSASGIYRFVYNIGPCSDTTTVTVTPTDAGADPSPVSCFSSGNATLTGTGTGLWTVDPSSPGTAIFGNAIFGNTTVSNFSAPGTYVLNWTANGCTDQVTVIVSDNCSCAIASNVVAPLNSSSYCGLSGPFFLNGQNATPLGGTYFWEYSLNSGAYAPADGTNNGQNYSSAGFGVGVHRLRRIYSVTGGQPCSDTSNVILLEVTPVPNVPVNLTASPNPACIGQTINLSATSSPGVTYAWIASPAVGSGLGLSSTASNTLNPTVAGLYTVSVTASANACTSNAAFVLVVIGDTPYTPNQSNFTKVDPTTCSTATGSISIAGFTANTSFTINYRKNSVAATATVVSNASGVITLSNLTAGVYDNFIFVGSGACSSSSTTALVTLTDPSAPSAPALLSASPNPSCLGPTINLSVTNNPGATYQWSASAPAAGIGSSTTSTNSLNPTASGFYTISVTQTVGGCVSAPSTVGVSINPTPPTPTAGTTSGISPTTCAGTNGLISLSGYTPNTQFTLEYSRNGSPISQSITSNASGVLIIPSLTAGTYTNFRITNVTACSSGIYAGPVNLTDPTAPSIPANLVALPNPVCLGTAVTLSVTSNLGATYTWSASSPNAGLAVSTTNSSSMNALSVGLYTISVTQTVSGCVSQPAFVSVNVQPSPPTPSVTTVIGSNPTTCGGTNGFITLSGLIPSTTYTLIYRNNGNLLNMVLVSNSGGTITLSNLATGTYTDFALRNAAGCTSGSYAGPITLTDPGSPAAPIGLTATPNPVCSGITVNLSVTNTVGATYAWTAPAGAGLVASSASSTIMVPNTPGTYIISVTQAQGTCVSPAATVSVTVNAIPSLPTSMTPMNPTVCSGSDGSLWLNGVAPNTSFTVAYTKNGSPQNATITSNASGVLAIINLTSGTYGGFRLTNSSGCSSTTSTQSVTLSDPNSPPAPANLTALPNPVCPGTSVSLAVTNNNGAVYTWSANNPNAGLVVSTNSTTTMNATTSGTYTISVFQNVAGCISAASTVNVVVNEIPPTPSANSITPTNPTCANADGNIVIAGYIPSTPYNLSYAFNGAPVSTTISSNSSGAIVISNLSGGTYTNFRVTNSTGCASGILAGPIVLNSPGLPAPPSGITKTPDFICLKSIVNIQVNPSTGAVFNWSASSASAGLNSNTSNNVTLNPTSIGIYNVSVTQTVGGCTSLPSVTTFEVRGDCYNPDFDATWVGVMTEGSVKTNDGNTSSSYRAAVAIPGNPSACLPSVASDGSYTFSCNTVGQYRFIVQACLNSMPSSCESVVLQITVLDFVPNNPPVVNHDYVRTKQGAPIRIVNSVNDKCQSFPNCSLTQPTIVTQAQNGTYNSTTGVYTPNAGFIGKDSIQYRVCQSPTVTPTNCTEAWMYITVIGSVNTNVTNAMDDYGQTAFNTTLVVNASNGLKANDTDPEIDLQNVVPLNQTIAGKGNITINADGSYTFIPTTGFSGPVYIPYVTCDQGNPSACDTATLHILVERFNSVGSIGNFVWHDQNGDGLQGANEPGMPGARVMLYDLNDVLIASTTTNSTGGYVFNNVTAGRYYIKFLPSAEYSFINYGQGGDPARDSDVTNQFGLGTTSYIDVLPGQQVLTVDAGIYICSKIGERVWYDTDKDNIYDANENGINSLTVEIWRKSGNQWVYWDNTKTGKKPGTLSTDGWWNFCVPPGEYYVQVIIPPLGLVPALPNRGNNPLLDSDITGTFGPGTTRSFTVLSAQNKLDLGAGFYPMAATGNLVWIDNNFNGIQESGEPTLANVPINVYDAVTDEMLGSTVTSANGTYMLDYLQQKEVYLKFVVPSGFIATRALGASDDKDSDVDHSNGINTTRNILLESGKTNPNIDLGVVLAPLPVNWSYVRASKKSDHHIVEWGTVSESNSEMFEVERSVNGVDNFTVIGKLKAAGNSSIVRDYLLQDFDIATFGTYYYRVKQIDLDGSFIYSNVVSLRNIGKPTIKLYPSPAKREAFVDLVLTDVSKVKVEMYDSQGKLIANPLPESTIDGGQHIITLPLQSLVNGVYMVSIIVNGEAQNLKLIKVE